VVKRTRYTVAVSELRSELQQVTEQLLRESEASGHVTLDQIGDAIGARAVSYIDVDAVIDALESAGRVVEAGAKPRGEEHLQVIVRSIRELSLQLGRRPTQLEIAERTGLTQAEVSHALQLARIMQR
jgi:hypothetical protein